MSLEFHPTQSAITRFNLKEQVYVTEAAPDQLLTRLLGDGQYEYDFGGVNIWPNFGEGNRVQQLIVEMVKDPVPQQLRDKLKHSNLPNAPTLQKNLQTIVENEQRIPAGVLVYRPSVGA